MSRDRSGDESRTVAVSRTVLRSASPAMREDTCVTVRSTPVLSTTAWAVTSLLNNPTYEVIRRVAACAAAVGLQPVNLSFSPVTGPEGNIEYLMFVQKSGEPSVLDDSVAEQVVAASHSTLDR